MNGTDDHLTRNLKNEGFYGFNIGTLGPKDFEESEQIRLRNQTWNYSEDLRSRTGANGGSGNPVCHVGAKNRRKKTHSLISG